LGEGTFVWALMNPLKLTLIEQSKRLRM
ncbi:MAG: hypothetical protein RIR28_193, partial [Pseudomonadota bacterium]